MRKIYPATKNPALRSRDRISEYRAQSTQMNNVVISNGERNPS
jgi:hypothetical protein